MIRRARPPSCVPLLVALAACAPEAPASKGADREGTDTATPGYPYATYVTESVTALCRKYEECDWLPLLEYEDVEACIEDGLSDIDADAACRGYDPVAAQACSEGWDALTCAELADSDTWPAACWEACAGR